MEVLPHSQAKDRIPKGVENSPFTHITSFRRGANFRVRIQKMQFLKKEGANFAKKYAI